MRRPAGRRAAGLFVGREAGRFSAGQDVTPGSGRGNGPEALPAYPWAGAIFAFSLVFPGAALAGTSDSLTLGQAQKMLFERNAELKAAAGESAAAQAAVGEAGSAWLPRFDATASYGYTTETGRLEIPLPGIPGGSLERELGDNDRVELGVDAAYLLFAGGARRHEMRARRAALRESRARAEAARNRLSLRLGLLHVAFEAAFARYDVQRRLLELREARASQAESLRESGLATVSAVASARAAALLQRAHLAEAEIRRDSLAREIAFLINSESPPARPASYELPRHWPEPGSDSAIAFARRPELAAMDGALEHVEEQREVLGAEAWPSLSANLGWRYANPGLDLASDAFMDYGVAGLNLRWNLFDGNRRTWRNRRLEAQREVLRSRRDLLEQGWRRDLLQAEDRWRLHKLEEEAAVSALEAARFKAVEMESLGRRGLATEVEVMEAHAEILGAEAALEQARAMKKAAHLAWLHAAGRELRF